ncbi:MAG: ribbon-helix-helix domain-containing protein [Actinomycetota bacterium]
MKKRSLMIAGHATSVSVEEEFWDELRAIALARGVSINQLAADIDASRPAEAGNLSSAIRLFVLAEVKRGRG